MFGTWHRGYLSLYEVRTTVSQTQHRVDHNLTCSQQVLVRQAKRIAISYPEPHKRKYLEAAESLRIAYWDWAENHQVPPVTAMPTVIVNKPVAGLVQPAAVRNPLYRFKYPQSALDGYFGRFDGKNSTRRCANDGETYPETANEKLASFNLKEKTVSFATFVIHRDVEFRSVDRVMRRFSLTSFSTTSSSRPPRSMRWFRLRAKGPTSKDPMGKSTSQQHVARISSLCQLLPLNRCCR